MESKKPISRNFYIILTAIIVVVAFILIRPYLVSIITGIILALIFYPIYKRLNKYIKNKGVCSFIFIIIALVIIILPIYLLSGALIRQSAIVYYSIKNIDLDITPVSDVFSRFFGTPIALDQILQDAVNKITNFIFDASTNFIFSLPQRIIGLFIILFILYYLLKESDTLPARLREALPLKEEQKNRLIKHVNDVIYATLYGVGITALIQGLVGTIGLFIFKASSPLLWGLVMTIFAMIPFLGTWIVWMPIAIIKLVSGDIFNGVGLLI